jgi:hypothetical protein
MNQAVGIHAVRCAIDPLEIEEDPFRFAGLPRGTVNPLNAVAAAKFPFQIDLPVETRHWHFGIEEERPPADFGSNIRTERQSALKTALPDITPGTDGIEYDVNTHEACPPAMTVRKP